MIIEMITTIAGPGIQANAGQEIDLPEKKAVELVESGYARYCKKTVVEPVMPKRKTKKPKGK